MTTDPTEPAVPAGLPISGARTAAIVFGVLMLAVAAAFPAFNSGVWPWLLAVFFTVVAALSFGVARVLTGDVAGKARALAERRARMEQDLGRK
jgi:4-amino-4-deoxy-L-arabinose transferase-like glycosyltransferase